VAEKIVNVINGLVQAVQHHRAQLTPWRGTANRRSAQAPPVTPIAQQYGKFFSCTGIVKSSRRASAVTKRWAPALPAGADFSQAKMLFLPLPQARKLRISLID